MLQGFLWSQDMDGKNQTEKKLLIKVYFLKKKQVKKIICSFPIPAQRNPVSEIEKAWKNEETIVDIIPQGTLAEKIRAAGAGIPAFFTKTGVGTIIEKEKETKIIDGEKFILEYSLSSDVALVRAHVADELGNLVYKGASRAFNPIMATAAKLTIVEADRIVSSKELDPERIGTPGIYVDRIVSKNIEI